MYYNYDAVYLFIELIFIYLQLYVYRISRVGRRYYYYLNSKIEII